MPAHIEESAQERARDGVGQVAHEPAAARDKGAEVDVKGVAENNLDVGGRARSQTIRQLLVELNRDDPSRVGGKRQREGAAAGTDLQEDVVRLWRDDTEQPRDRC